MSEAEKERSHVGTGANARLGDAAAVVLTPLRAAALVAVGGTSLAVQAAHRRLASVVGEGERQLDLFARSVRRFPFSLWPLGRKGARTAQRRRPPSSTATG